MNEQLLCEFCEQPLSEHTVAGRCPKQPTIEIDVRLLTPWETIGVAILGAVNELTRKGTQSILARAAIRSIGYEGGRVEDMRRSSVYGVDRTSVYYKARE